MSGINEPAQASSPTADCCTNNGALMAGMAYWANTNDIRPDTSDIKTTGMQTVQTYWVDVLELQTYQDNNQYYLATKYGGANLPADFNPATRTHRFDPGVVAHRPPRRTRSAASCARTRTSPRPRPTRWSAAWPGRSRASPRG